MQHLELTSTVSLKTWQSALQGTDATFVFQDHAQTFQTSRTFGISTELKKVVDDFGGQSEAAIFAIRYGMIEGVWVDPLHNYIAIVFSKAKGDDEDVVLINSLMNKSVE